MKINMTKFYKATICTFLFLGVLIILWPLVFVIIYIDEKLEAGVVLGASFVVGVAIASFPFLLNYRQLFYVYVGENGSTSYTLLGRKLCQVDYNQDVFYIFFNVKFLYACPVKFIAISNTPITYKENQTSYLKRFYGSYNRKQVIVLPYYNRVKQFLNLDDWFKLQ